MQSDTLPTTDREPAGVRVLLADDHPVVLSGLTALLESIHGVVVVGQAADGRAAVREAAPCCDRTSS